MLHDHIGYDRYTEIASDTSDSVLGTLKKMLPEKSWMIIGGGALVLHLNKSVRTVSPDLDIMMTPIMLSKVAGKFGHMEPGTFGHSVNVNGLTVDFLAATRAWENSLIQQADIIHGVPVVPLWGLIVLKAEANRDKDIADLQLIYNDKPEAFVKARVLLKKVLPNEVEDFDNLMLLLQHIKQLQRK